MSIVSLEFIGFLISVFFIYWKIPDGHKQYRHVFIIFSSYGFYGMINIWFPVLLFLVSIVNYLAAKRLIKCDNHQKHLVLILTIGFNLFVLGLFKYFNFFVENVIELLTLVGLKSGSITLQLLIPIGLSFYIFKGLSFVLDVYYEKIDFDFRLKDILLYLSFFPQLTSGPIDRFSEFKENTDKTSTFDYEMVVDGSKQIVWGFFKKLVIADNLAVNASAIFDNYQLASGSMLLFGALLFSVQIYADFSGYSDIAVGSAKLLGIRTTKNFNYPYFAKNIQEFWRRWHISLTSWFMEYVFTPLSMAFRGKSFGIVSAVIITFVISGLWHGANWTFVAWGFFHGILFVPSILLRNKFKSLNTKSVNIQRIINLFKVIFTFTSVSLLWVFFISNNLEMALTIFGKIFSNSLFSPIDGQRANLPLILIFFIIELLSCRKEHPFHNLRLNTFFRYSFYFIVLAMILLFSSSSDKSFVYSQF